MAADIQSLHSRIAVIQGERPYSTCGHGKFAISMVAGHSRSHRLENIGRVINIGSEQLTRRYRRAEHRCVINPTCFNNKACRKAGNDRRIIQACIVNRDCRPAQRPVTQSNGIDKGIVQILRVIQRLETGFERSIKR